MLTNKFSLGFRIPINISVGEVLEVMLQSVPFEDLIGCRILLANPLQSEVLPYESRIIVWDGFPLSQARKAHKSALNSLPWMAALAEDTPILEKNYLVHCEEIANLGTVQEDGTLSGNSSSYGKMTFAMRSASKHAGEHHYLIVGEGALCNKAANCLVNNGRTGTLAFMRLPGKDGHGFVPSLVQGLGGRYLNCDGKGYIGILPDGTAVVDETTASVANESSSLDELIAFVSAKGFTKIYMPISLRRLTDMGDKMTQAIHSVCQNDNLSHLSITLLTDDPASSVCLSKLEQVRTLPETKTILERMAFLKKLKNATHLVVVERDGDPILQKEIFDFVPNHILRKKYLMIFNADTGELESHGKYGR